MLSKKPEKFNLQQGRTPAFQTSLRTLAVCIVFLYTSDTETHLWIFTPKNIAQLYKLCTGPLILEHQIGSWQLVI